MITFLVAWCISDSAKKKYVDAFRRLEYMAFWTCSIFSYRLENLLSSE